MKTKICTLCFNKATRISKNSTLCFCDECYSSMKDDYEISIESETNMSFDEYYQIVEIDNNGK